MRKYNIVFHFFTLSIPFTTQATCTPTPDCASIGYNATSCDGKFIRCPFDTSKLFCIPCDSSYRYTCNGNYVASGSGTACNGKYADCKCVSGASLGDKTCECDTTCSVGNIYYADGSCSSCLENSKIPIGVVVKNNELIIGNQINYSKWSPDSINIPEITDILDRDAAKTDYNGKNKTQAIANHYGISADISTHAGVYCYTYSPIGMESTKGQWYLPALGELNDYVYTNYNKIKSSWNLLNITYIEEWFWSATESHSGGAWDMHISTGSTASGSNKTNGYSTACLLPI